ncbi:hypothetical protein [Oleiharenicola lentus]|uniref:hypothetical protein n=1 Tax=Oleiharenicola lentus TaxID=2508720 RepID=UPI003F66909B
MRNPFRFILGFLTLAVAASAADVTFVRVLSNWRDASSFRRVSEYFTGKENPGDSTILRTHAEERSGYYFLVRLANTGGVTPVKIQLHLVTPIDAKPKLYTFETTLQPKKNILNLGLTGTDWPDSKANPVAWKIDVLASDGALIASEKSYLWNNPPAK